MELFIGLNIVMYIFFAFAGIYLANSMFGVGINCLVKGEKFEWRKLFVSFMKIVMSAAAMVVIVVTFNLIAKGANALGAEIYETVVSIISVGAYSLLFIKGFVMTAIDVYTKLRDLYEIKDNTTFDISIIENMKIQRPANEFNVDTVSHEKADTAINGVG